MLVEPMNPTIDELRRVNFCPDRQAVNRTHLLLEGEQRLDELPPAPFMYDDSGKRKIVGRRTNQPGIPALIHVHQVHDDYLEREGFLGKQSSASACARVPDLLLCGFGRVFSIRRRTSSSLS